MLLGHRHARGFFLGFMHLGTFNNNTAGGFLRTELPKVCPHHQLASPSLPASESSEQSTQLSREEPRGAAAASDDATSLMLSKAILTSFTLKAIFVFWTNSSGNQLARESVKKIETG